MRHILKSVLIVLALLGLVGCTMLSAGHGDPAGQVAASPTPASRATAQPSTGDGAYPPTPTPKQGYGAAQYLVERAIADLRGRLDIRVEQVTVQEVVPAEFHDASLGVPEPDTVYAQVVTPGYVIRLAAGGEAYEYHGSGERVVLAPELGQPPVSPEERVRITGVRVDGAQITVEGESAVPSGTCVRTRLLGNGQAQAWWPAVACAPVRDGAWRMVVTLGTGERPDRLDPTAAYEVRAWQEGEPISGVGFPFDLAGPPTPPLPGRDVYHRVEIVDAGLSFEVPNGWLRLGPEWAWTPKEGSDLWLGLNWMDLQPPMEPEAVMLPNNAQTLYSEEVALSWGQGRRFLLEVYAPVAAGSDAKAPVASVESHVLVFVRRDGARRAFDLYARGATLADLDALTPLLQRALDTTARSMPSPTPDEAASPG